MERIVHKIKQVVSPKENQPPSKGQQPSQAGLPSSSSIPFESPQDFYHRITQKPEVRRLLERLAKR